VDGYAVHASIADGTVFVPDDLAANHRRVDGEPVHPTNNIATKTATQTKKADNFRCRLLS